MNCDICKRAQEVLKHWAWLKTNMVGGTLEIHSICEVCAQKIHDFLRAIGWGLSGHEATPIKGE